MLHHYHIVLFFKLTVAQWENMTFYHLNVALIIMNSFYNS